MSSDNENPLNRPELRADAPLASELTIRRKIDKAAKADRGRLIRQQKSLAKSQRRQARKQLRSELGDDAVPKTVVRTIENTREIEDSFVDDEDEEILHDQEFDELSGYFNREKQPRVLLTTSPKAKSHTVKFCLELNRIIPGTEVFPRRLLPLKKVVKQAIDAGFTDVAVIHDDKRKKVPDGLLLCHLPEGPTAYFKINSFKWRKDIKEVGDLTGHYPEVILNNFSTRLGLLVSRMLLCLFPQDPQFTGRRVVTFHNQRDYIFFRHHRYEFKREGEKAALHELGPRFTLRLKWIQKGTFDPNEGEYEFVFKRHEMETSRRRFLL